VLSDVFELITFYFYLFDKLFIYSFLSLIGGLIPSFTQFYDGQKTSDEKVINFDNILCSQYSVSNIGDNTLQPKSKYTVQ